ncbi:MAG: 4Fe-4S binding protein [Armatimonadota bacterium]|nr:4Fe-4S binding protein [bacterium]
MAKRIRQIIKIDEEKCNGCGLCVSACHEGALQIIDGKAKLVSETYCDGLGACLGECPQGALTFESREADEFDEAAVAKHLAPVQVHNHEHKGGGFVCPSAKILDRTHQDAPKKSPAAESTPSELRQWPVKLYLVNPHASYFQDADLLLAADCTAFTLGSFHADFLRDRTLVTGCPKFDDVSGYLDKLTDILAYNSIKSITVVQMEVPCCSGLLRLAQMAVTESRKNIPLESVVISLEGEVKERKPLK